MRAFDREAIEKCRVPGLVLMENAGRGAADVIGRLFAPIESKRVAVVCGSGNNGGDGFVIARHLLTRRANVGVWLAGQVGALKGDARVNGEAWAGLGGQLVELATGGDLGAFENELGRVDLIVDALFGTGLDRPIRGWLESVISEMNRAAPPKVAIDLPSGLDADTGAALGTVVMAHATVTFGHYKTGLLTPQGSRAAGAVHVVDLGVPARLVERVGCRAYTIDADGLRAKLGDRPVTSHKHSAGDVLVMAGSPGRVGAALLVGRSALRAGAGLVTLASWPEAIEQVESRVVELMTSRLDPDAIERSVEIEAAGRTVVVAGPGFGIDDDARRALDYLAFHVDATKVLDADALTLFSGRAESLAHAPGRFLLTPHPGEAARLLGKTSADVERDRFAAARELTSRTQATVVLKGAHTIVASPDTTYVNMTGNPALATAGSGDVLAGVLAALACTLPPLEAACAAAFAHGYAADLWRAEHHGADRGLLAGELAERMPDVLAALARGEALLPV
jgi:ADP-dependent NAD(P)H-hydrate dehydratase / NAD(P)H-hydrate epimerase